MKGADRLGDPETLAKKERGERYCELMTHWGRADGYKDWRYLFIPADEAREGVTFMGLAERYGVR